MKMYIPDSCKMEIIIENFMLHLYESVKSYDEVHKILLHGIKMTEEEIDYFERGLI